MFEPSTLPATLAAVEVPVLFWTGVFATTIVWVLVSNLRQFSQTRQRERTRREIAAYVAEGSISPADARTMMGADETEFEKKIADAVSWGMLSSKKAEQLLKALRDDRESRERSANPASMG